MATIAPSSADPFGAILGRYEQYLQTPAQLRTGARNMVSDSINSSIAANNAMIQGQSDMYSRQAQRAQGMAGALAQTLAPDPTQIANLYGQAADRGVAYGTGLTGAVGADWAANAQAMKDKVAQVTGGQGQTNSFDPASMQNSAQLANVVLPGASLADQAAAAGAMAQYGRVSSAQNIGNIAQQYLQRQNDLQNQVTAQSASMEAQRPQMEREALMNLTSQQRQDMATLTSGLGMASMMGYRQGMLTGQTPSGQMRAGYWQNPQSGLIQKIPANQTVVTNPSTGQQRLVPLPSSSGASSPAGVAKQTQALINTNTSSIDKLASSGAYATVSNAYELAHGYEKTPKYAPAQSYANARAGLIATLPPNLRKNPQMLARVDQTLAKYGYKKGK